jgi:hypothetical protein
MDASTDATATRSPAKRQCPYCREWCAHPWCGRCCRALDDRVPLDHDYGDDATLLANFLTVPHPTLRQQAAITLLCMAVKSGRTLPVVDEQAVLVCAVAIASVTLPITQNRPIAICGTLAHLACRAFARHQWAEPTGAVEVHALLAIGEACADVMGMP